MTALFIPLKRPPDHGGFGSYSAILRTHNDVLSDLQRRAEVDAKGDLLAVGGYRMLLGPFMGVDISASNTMALRFEEEDFAPTTFAALRPGSVTGISIRFEGVGGGADVVTVKILVNGTAKTTVTVPKDPPLSTHTLTFARNQAKFTANDLIGISATPGAAYVGTSDIVVFLELRM